jgi:cell division transport system permease protein
LAGTGRLKSDVLKSYDYVTKEAAAKQHTDIIGEDFDFLVKPLQNSLTFLEN